MTIRPRLGLHTRIWLSTTVVFGVDRWPIRCRRRSSGCCWQRARACLALCVPPDGLRRPHDFAPEDGSSGHVFTAKNPKELLRTTTPQLIIILTILSIFEANPDQQINCCLFAYHKILQKPRLMIKRGAKIASIDFVILGILKQIDAIFLLNGCDLSSLPFVLMKIFSEMK